MELLVQFISGREESLLLLFLLLLCSPYSECTLTFVMFFLDPSVACSLAMYHKAVYAGITASTIALILVFL